MVSWFIVATAMALPLGIIVVATRAKQQARSRDYEHRERMKAIEAGISPFGPLRGPGAWPSLVALGLGGFMPVGVFFIAWLANETSHVGDGVFLGATVVAALGVLGGTRMGIRLLQPADPMPAIPAPPEHVTRRKPSFNADAYDTIAHRG
jgi:hypothetical protein